MEHRNLFTQSVLWRGDKLILLDQTKLPLETEYLEIDDIKDAWEAIKALKVRGAPAIGIAAAYGLVLGVKDAPEKRFDDFWEVFSKQKNYLASSRPTAVNLFWALNRMETYVQNNKELPVAEIKKGLLEEAHAILKEDTDVCRSIGEYAVELLKDGMGVLTHCNAGSIATSGYGTALAPIYLAKSRGWNIRVFADETRPLLQGARLTTWELMQAGIDVTLITDNMAAHVMSRGWVDAVIVGCDRVAANGDTANKIGTYGVAILAKEHNIPFYVAAPTSTIDLDTPTGAEIVIEERHEEEITEGFGKRTAPVGVKVYNPAFDVTPAKYITAIITEKGIVRAPYEEGLKRIFGKI
jgi:methylthioribose-1-phosphate isomerase